MFLKKEDIASVNNWVEEGFSVPLPTPDRTIVFVTPEDALEIEQSRIRCIGCLSSCNFSGWQQTPSATGRIPDPRSFCIQNTLQQISLTGDTENALMFCGHQGYRFAEDPFYEGGRIPSVRELFAQICIGN